MISWLQSLILPALSVARRANLTPDRFPKGQRYCAFNVTRESFLCVGMTRADTPWARLRGLLGRRSLETGDGLWLVPSQGVHTFGMRFPIDAIYLDRQDRVVAVEQDLSPFRVGPFRRAAASVIELPIRSVLASQTQEGDQLLLCTPQQMTAYLKEKNTAPAREDKTMGKAYSAGLK